MGTVATNSSRPLSTRQRQVLTCAANGFTSKQTAQVLGISTATVRVHMEAARRRLNARSIAHAVAISMGADLIDPMSIPPLESGDGGIHRIPHRLAEENKAEIAYDPRCPACRDYGDWRNGIPDRRFYEQNATEEDVVGEE